MHWQEVTTPRKVGGLGIREVRKNNIALLAKNGAQMVAGSQEFWATCLRSKYVKGVVGLNIHASLSSSPTWKGIVKSFGWVKDGYVWQRGNGSTISFWFDGWLEDTPLSQLVADIHPADKSLKVADLCDERGQWQLQRLLTPLPADLQHRILRFSCCMEEVDTFIWTGQKDGIPTAKSFFKFVDGAEDARWNKDCVGFGNLLVLSGLGFSSGY